MFAAAAVGGGGEVSIAAALPLEVALTAKLEFGILHRLNSAEMQWAQKRKMRKSYTADFGHRLHRGARLLNAPFTTITPYLETP